jgi:deazaflavin-dependent oxidoreductase (nitroreductase family)
MTGAGAAPFFRLVKRAAASPPAGWLLARMLPRLDRATLTLTGGRRSLTSMATGLPVVLVTTTGARSGRRLTVPLLAVRDPQDPAAFALVASNWGRPRHPAWYHNLRAHPRATVARSGRPADYEAHEAAGEAYERYWRLAAEAYPGYRLYRQRAGGRRIPIIIMIPAEA